MVREVEREANKRRRRREMVELRKIREKDD
jgi:hypothetical protein